MVGQAQQALFQRVVDGYDELLDETGQPRAHWSELLRSLGEMGTAGLIRLRSRVARQVESDGITYNPVGVPGLAVARAAVEAARPPASHVPVPWPLDPVPMMLGAQEWAALERGLAQRTRLSALLLDDLYGPQRTLTSGLIPPELVFAHRGYLRMALNTPKPDKPVLLAAFELARKPSGEFVVHSERTGAPSGVGYAVAGRRVLMRAAPGVFQAVGPRSLGPFVQALRLALIEAAPAGVDDPTVVVLSPGTGSETAFDQAHLALIMGFPLVQAPDLVVREGTLWMRSLGTLKRVDVVLRRVDAQFVDPLDLRPDSQLGVAGLVEAANRGSVSIVNSIGSGVLENPAFAVLYPELARAMLDEDLLLPSASVLWAGRQVDRERIISDLEELVVKDIVTGSSQAGSAMSEDERARLQRRLHDEPWRWAAQPPMRLSCVPVLPPAFAEPGASDLAEAPVLLRCFTVGHGDQVSVLPGGLGQVMVFDEASGLPVSTSTKDVWVAHAEPATTRAKQPSELGVRVVAADQPPLPHQNAAPGETVTSPRVLSDLFWMGRYGERAEALARLLIVIRERLQEQRLTSVSSKDEPKTPFSEGLQALFEAVERVTASPPHASELSVGLALRELQTLTFDRDRPGSLAQSVDRLGNAAQGVRDQLSVDTWMVLADLERALDPPSATADGALHLSSAGGHRSTSDELVPIATAQSQVLAGMLALSGLAAESMVRDAGWRITDIGKRIERGLQLTSLVRATLAHQREPEVERALMEAVLSSVESAVIYRRRHHLRTRVSTVAELIFFDADNPRSLVYQIDALRRNLQALPDAARSTRAEHALESIFALLRRVEPDELERLSAQGERTELIQWLAAMHDGLRELATIIESSRLTAPRQMRPLWGGGTEQAWS